MQKIAWCALVFAWVFFTLVCGCWGLATHIEVRAVDVVRVAAGVLGCALWWPLLRKALGASKP